MGAERNVAHDACFHMPDDFLAGQVEDRIENLSAFPRAGLPDDEEYASAVLDVAGRKQLASQDLHDDRRLRAIEAPGISTSVQFGEERSRPLVVAVPQLFEQV